MITCKIVLIGHNMDESVALIKGVEATRLFATPHKADKFNLLDEDISLDDGDCDIDNLVLGHLCGSLMDEVMDDPGNEGSSDSGDIPRKKTSKSLKGKKSSRVKSTKKGLNSK
jgi:hypothetical protein